MELFIDKEQIKELNEILKYAKAYDEKERCLSDKQKEIINNFKKISEPQPNATINPEYIEAQTKKMSDLSNKLYRLFHEKADELMCEILVDLGFEDLVTIFNSIEKDYN